MIKKGAVDEVNRFINNGFTFPMAIGIKELSEYIKGAISIDSAIIQMYVNTRQYAKRQMTWFRNKIDNYDMIINTDLY